MSSSVVEPAKSSATPSCAAVAWPGLVFISAFCASVTPLGLVPTSPSSASVSTPALALMSPFGASVATPGLSNVTRLQTSSAAGGTLGRNDGPDKGLEGQAPNLTRLAHGLGRSGRMVFLRCRRTPRLRTPDQARFPIKRRAEQVRVATDPPLDGDTPPDLDHRRKVHTKVVVEKHRRNGVFRDGVPEKSRWATTLVRDLGDPCPRWKVAPRWSGWAAPSPPWTTRRSVTDQGKKTGSDVRDMMDAVESEGLLAIAGSRSCDTYTVAVSSRYSSCQS